MSRVSVLGRLARVVGMPILALLAMSAPQAKANLHFELGTLFNGATQPTSTPPYLIADFTDTAANTVTLTLTSSLETSSEFIDDITFNVNPNFTPSGLTITQLTGVTVNSISNTTDDAQNLTGGGLLGKGFDVNIEFKTSAANRFKGTDVATFQIVASGLTAADFNYTSLHGLFIAAHIQGIPLPGGGTTSGAVTVPEPTSVALVGLGIGGLALATRRRRAK